MNVLFANLILFEVFLHLIYSNALVKLKENFWILEKLSIEYQYSILITNLFFLMYEIVSEIKDEIHVHLEGRKSVEFVRRNRGP